MIRKPAVAGKFYPASPDQLRETISGFIVPSSKKSCAGIMVPHAGYVYSGGVAGAVYSRVEVPTRIIILSPNHTGLGARFSIMDSGIWELPFGNANIDSDFAEKLLGSFPALEADQKAHLHEHSIEVQLPFIQFVKNDFKFVPITLSHIDLESCLKLGDAIADVTGGESAPTLIVASSDMNHHEDEEATQKKDHQALQAILEMDAVGLYETVHKNGITMCGVIPATVMLSACNKLNASKAELVDHKTSGDVTGDYSSVVGYAGVTVC